MLSVTIPIKPYSVNKYFYGNRAIKRRETVEWESSFIEHLREDDIQTQIKEFRDRFDPERHCIHIDIETVFPESILYTKKGMLSSKAFDVSNMEKPIIDVLFLKKYSTPTSKNLEIDDKYITKMSSEKTAGEDYSINVKLQLLDLPRLEDK